MMSLRADGSTFIRPSLLFGVSATALILGTPALAQTATQSATDAAPAPSTTTTADAPQTLTAEQEVESGQNASTDCAVNPNGPACKSAIVVTGSRIRRPNLESPLPVTSVGGEEFFQTGVVSVGDTLNDLPSIRNTFTTANSTRFLGTTGLSLLDLRGLGTNRTLVLINGRRHVPGDGSASVDINTIPADLIDRVDVVTGGNSAVYGSDAIAGVVNFILKQDYDGIQVRGQGGLSKYHDLGSEYVSVLAGQNFSDGRGNIAANFEIARQDPAYGGHRGGSWAQANRFVAEDGDPAGTPNGSDGNPDNVFYQNITYPFFENGGGFYEFLNQPFEGGAVGTPYIFLPDGTLVPKTGTIVGRPNRPFSERYLGGNGSNGLENELFVLSPQNNRYSLNVIGHYTISDAFEPFIEAKYVHQLTQHQPSGPFFFGFGTATGSPREVFSFDNPFLTDQAKGVIADYYGISPDTPGFLFNMTSNAADLGGRNDKLTRDTYRIVGGVRGNFNDDWNYEVSLNYGLAKQKNRIQGNVNLQRFLLAIDAVRDPVSGNIVCRSQIDPSAAIALETALDPAYAASTLAADVAACRPANFFGEGNLSQAAKDYLLQDTTSHQKYTQFDLSGFVSGDTSEFLNLPGGPIGFSVGAELRKETLRSTQEQAVLAGMTFYNALGNIEGIPSFEVKELFGEVRLPILKDLPFAHELTVSAAGRLSDYKGKTGTVNAWNISGEWAPIADIRFRANVAKAVRAPNLTELYFPLSQNFSFLSDPCSLDFIGTGTSNREANCRAAGIPDTYNYNRGPTYLYLSGGNPDLQAETSKSYTFGGVLLPRFIPGLSLTADYYNITVNNVITAPSAQQIFDACYDLPSLDNPFCALFQRNPGPGNGPRGEPPFSLLLGSLRDVAANFAKLKVRGVDVEAAYRHQLGSVGRLDTRFTWTHVFQNDQFIDPTNPEFADQLLLELGNPKDAFNWNVNLSHGPFELGYQMRYISHMLTSSFENYYSKQGRDPQNADVNNIKWYPEAFYHDVRFGYNASTRYNFYVGVDNLTNKRPPLDVSGTGGGSGIYDNRGRFYYAGAIAKF